MFPIRGLDVKVVLISLCILCYSTQSEGRPVIKRSISEVQLMHNLGEHKHVQERQDWLQMKLRDIHTASLRNDLLDLEELTPNEVEYILNILEKLLNAQ
uniref:Parathyroid hormone n=2 Tax=Oncorhynchus TaxID=8016 RepID=A0A8C7KHI2_ONCKI